MRPRRLLHFSPKPLSVISPSYPSLSNSLQGQIRHFHLPPPASHPHRLKSLLCESLRWVSSSPEKRLPSALDVAVEGFCENRDFGGLRRFLEEWRYAPCTRVCNRIAYSMCFESGCDAGDDVWSLLRKLEGFGAELDCRTFRILIGWSCRNGDLRGTNVYFSEMVSRKLEPDVYSYNAVFSGLFKKRMSSRVREVLIGMVERGIRPDSSTFRVLLAGYCRDMKFDEARLVFDGMVRCGMAFLSSSEDAISKIFTVLGLEGVKVKRINNVGIQKAEFFDSVGNGLYLYTDVDEYCKILTGILDDSFVPDFTPALLAECEKGNMDTALKVKEEAPECGQKLPLCAYSALLKCVIGSWCHVKVIVVIFDKLKKNFSELDHQTLNLLTQSLAKKGILIKAKQVIDNLLRRELPIDNETYTTLLMGFSREGNQDRFQEYWGLAKGNGFLPGNNHLKYLISGLCKFGMLEDVLQLYQAMLEKCSHTVPAICDTIVKELCNSGYATTGHKLVKENTGRTNSLDYMMHEYLIKGYCKEGKFDEAVGVLDLLLDENIPITSSIGQLLLPWLIRTGDVEKAMTVKQVLATNQPETLFSVYKILISELCKIGNVNKSSVLLHEMVSGGLHPDSHILNMMIRAYCKANKLKKSYEMVCLLLKMQGGMDIISYRSVIRLNCSQGQVSDCFRLTKVFTKEFEHQPLMFYNILLFYLFKMGSIQLVEAVLDELHWKKIVLDQVSYNFLILGYYRCGNVVKSVDTLSAMISRNFLPSQRSMRIVINYLCKCSELSKALQLSNHMNIWGMKHGSVVQNALVEGLLSQGKLDEADILLHSFEEANLIPSNIYYDTVIKRFCEHGRIDRAVNLLNLMLTKGSFPAEYSYDCVIYGLVAQRKFDQALHFHAEMKLKNLQPQLKTYNGLILGLCEIRRIDDARTVLELSLLSGIVPHCNTIYSVINGYCAENNSTRASRLLYEMQQSGHLPDFETHWSLISNLNDANNRNVEDHECSLSHLLSHGTKDSTPKKYSMSNRPYS